MTERALQTKVIKYLRGLGGLWLNTSPGPYAPKGIADIIGCYDGMYVAIELKNPKYKFPCDELSPAQRKFMIDVTSAGGHFLCAASMDDVYDFMDYLASEVLKSR